jgi:branched-chain amino acid transport system permease protein
MDALLSQYIDAYYLHLMVLIGINIILVLGLNIITGVTGQLSMGHAGFMSIGAYTAAIMSVHLAFPFWASLLAGTQPLFGAFPGPGSGLWYPE